MKYKLIVYAPISHANKVREVLASAGAGSFGKYSSCSFSVSGVGRFKPEDGAQPFVGQVGKTEEVPEERIEVTVGEKILPKVLEEMKKVHPYEEPAYDVFRLEDF